MRLIALLCGILVASISHASSPWTVQTEELKQDVVALTIGSRSQFGKPPTLMVRCARNQKLEVLVVNHNWTLVPEVHYKLDEHEPHHERWEPTRDGFLSPRPYEFALELRSGKTIVMESEPHVDPDLFGNGARRAAEIPGRYAYTLEKAADAIGEVLIACGLSKPRRTELDEIQARR